MRANVPMTRDVIVVPPELPLDVAWQIMVRHRIRHLPVVRARALIGILGPRRADAWERLARIVCSTSPPASSSMTR